MEPKNQVSDSLNLIISYHFPPISKSKLPKKIARIENQKRYANRYKAQNVYDMANDGILNS